MSVNYSELKSNIKNKKEIKRNLVEDEISNRIKIIEEQWEKNNNDAIDIINSIKEDTDIKYEYDLYPYKLHPTEDRWIRKLRIIGSINLNKRYNGFFRFRFDLVKRELVVYKPSSFDNATYLNINWNDDGIQKLFEIIYE